MLINLEKMNNKQWKTVSIQGVKGAFHEIAARAYFSDEEIEIVECETFNDVVNSVKNGLSDFGILAIENSIAGSILSNYRIIQESKMKISGEIFIPVQQNLMTLPGQSIQDITEVYSHPMAIQQCEVFFSQHPGIKVIESTDTAISAREIREAGILGRGAIASKMAASIYGLDIIAESIETNKRNYTRFLIIKERTSGNTAVITHKIDKSSLCFSLSHESGSLANVLSVLAIYKMNLTKIQSMPILGKEWEYFFHIDIVFDNYLRFKQAINAIEPLTNNIEILGEYRSYNSLKEVETLNEFVYEN